jgi:hypothetical protein
MALQDEVGGVGEAGLAVSGGDRWREELWHVLGRSSTGPPRQDWLGPLVSKQIGAEIGDMVNLGDRSRGADRGWGRPLFQPRFGSKDGEKAWNWRFRGIV